MSSASLSASLRRRDQLQSPTQRIRQMFKRRSESNLRKHLERGGPATPPARATAGGPARGGAGVGAGGANNDKTTVSPSTTLGQSHLELAQALVEMRWKEQLLFQARRELDLAREAAQAARNAQNDGMCGACVCAFVVLFAVVLWHHARVQSIANDAPLACTRYGLQQHVTERMQHPCAVHYTIAVTFGANNGVIIRSPDDRGRMSRVLVASMCCGLRCIDHSVLGPVSYTHLTLPTNREV